MLLVSGVERVGFGMYALKPRNVCFRFSVQNRSLAPRLSDLFIQVLNLNPQP